MATDPARNSPSFRRPLIALLVAVAVVAPLLYALFTPVEVLEKGRLLPYTEGKIYKVRFGGWLTLYLEPELKPDFDLLNAFLLTGVAFIALTFGVVLAAGGESSSSPRLWFFVIVFLGVSYLVADETLGLHESIGHNLPFLAGLPLVDRPDDLVVAMLALPAVGILVLFRSVVLASRRATGLFAAGLAVFLLAAVADLLNLPGEEAVEVVATACLAAAMLVLGLHHLGPRSGPLPESSQEPPAGETR